MKHPLHHAHDCTDCGGFGLTEDADYDEDGLIYRKNVRCEGCDGCGMTTSCDRCDEVMPVSEAEMLSYVCGPCRAGVEQGDASAEMARLRRWA